jgi:hypothetical protein
LPLPPLPLPTELGEEAIFSSHSAESRQSPEPSSGMESAGGVCSSLFSDSEMGLGFGEGEACVGEAAEEGGGCED